jgi:hypothetical protein
MFGSVTIFTKQIKKCSICMGNFRVRDGVSVKCKEGN